MDLGGHLHPTIHGCPIPSSRPRPPTSDACRPVPAVPFLTATQPGSGAGIWLDGGAGVIDPWLLACHRFATDLLFWRSNILTHIWSYLASPGIALVLPCSTTLGLDSLWYPCSSAKKHHSSLDCLHSCTSRSIWNLFGSRQLLLSYSWIDQGAFRCDSQPWNKEFQVEPSVPGFGRPISSSRYTWAQWSTRIMDPQPGGLNPCKVDPRSWNHHKNPLNLRKSDIEILWNPHKS